MTHKLVHGTVVDTSRKVIHAVRIIDEILDYETIDEIAEKMRAHALSRYGEQTATVVVIQGVSRETLRLFGDSYAVERVRTAMFNAALTFMPIDWDETRLGLKRRCTNQSHCIPANPAALIGPDHFWI